ncbi:MAG: Gfo/Idh/MocA family oxidoreductase [Planctomycetaceae bacterium]|nr:Gfo/Idh/MocA family oxidoreductase [Planctomycetaceae bacterium]
MIRVAVIGAGNWGKNLVRTFNATPGAELRYVVDVNEKTLKTLGALYPRATMTADLNQVLQDKDIDACVVAVDAPRHHAVAKACLQAGKHTYVEKPLALNGREATELVDLATANGRHLMVGHLLEYHPAVNYMKDMIAQESVGQPLYLYFHRVNLGVVRTQENAWWSLAPHDISVACYLFGAQPVSVTATGQSFLQPGIEDVVFATLRFADGKLAHIHVSWLDPHKIRKVTLVGSQKMVVFDDMDASQKIWIHDKGAVVKSVESYVEAITLRTGDILIPRISSQEPLMLECQHFIESITKNTTPRSDGQDGLRVVRVLEAGSRSLQEGGKPVTI